MLVDNNSIHYITTCSFLSKLSIQQDKISNLVSRAVEPSYLHWEREKTYQDEMLTLTLQNVVIIAQFYDILRNRMRWEGQIIPKDK